MKRCLLIFLSFFFSLVHASEKPHEHNKENTNNCFVRNQGQWPREVLYQAKLFNSILWVEEQGLKFQLVNPGYGSHDFKPKAHETREQVFTLKFDQSQTVTRTEGKGEKGFYLNYLIGNDRNKWANRVKAFSEVVLYDVYEGIDLQLRITALGLQYNLIVRDATHLADLASHCEGMIRRLNANSGGMQYETNFGLIEETAPIILKNGKALNGAVKNVLNADGSVSYQVSKELEAPFTIDPTIVFATFSGSTNDNWGFCATHDPQGLFINTGITFGLGYPLTNGAFYFQGDPTTDSYSNSEISISKYSANGSSLIYSTVVGGSESECPAATVCNSSGELYVMGPTSSLNFPTHNYSQQSFAGGTSVTNMSITFANGTDLFIMKLSPDGTSLLSSTYYGGSKNEGIGVAATQCKGDIDVIEPSGNVFVSSYSASTNLNLSLPTQSTAFDYRALAIKFNPVLNQVQWAGVLDSCSAYSFGFSLSAKNENEFYVVGKTTAGVVPTANNLINQTASSLSSHGIIWYVNISNPFANRIKYVANQFNTTIQLCDYHQGHLYMCGTTNGGMNQINSPSNFTNNKNFILKVDSALTTVSLLTLKAGNALNDAIAFKVDNCGRIYYSAFNPTINASSYSGVEITPDAYQFTSPSGNDIIMSVFGPAGNSLFGSFYGEESIQDHDDGGHSEYSEEGKLYLAVCGSCGGSNNGFAVTAGAYSTTNNSSNCNAVSFLANVGKPAIKASFGYTTTCGSLEFLFNSNFENPQIKWYVNTELQAVGSSFNYTFPDTSSYQVCMVLPGTACYSGDSIIKVIHPTAGTYDLQFTVSQINCNQSVVVTTAGATSATASINFGDGDVVILGGDQSYVHNFVNNNNMPDSIYITLSNLYCVKTTAYAINPVLNKDIDTALVICSKKKQVQLDGLPGMTNYIWDNTIYLDKPYGQLVMFDPTNFPGGDITCTEQYQSSGNNNCYRRVRYNINFSVNASLEMNVIPNVTAINLGDEVELTATPYGGINYQWQPVGIMQSNGSNKVIAKPTTDTTIVLYIADPKTPACDLRIAIPIQVEEFPCDEGSIDIANCVTPNGDLVNDYVMAHTAIVKDYRLLIYNRWGNVVFETNDPNEKWRATCNGKDCDDGVYGYMASSTCLNGKTILKKGNITVIR